MIKIKILGNCQAAPVAVSMKRLAQTSADIEALKPIHTIYKSEYRETINKLDQADVIIHQPIGASYGALSSVELKKRFTNKCLISFPSLYFSGYSPYLGYLRLPEGGTLQGTLNDYHDLRVVEGFLLKKSVQDVVDGIKNQNRSSEIINHAHRSIEELKDREAEIDIKISDFINENFLKKRLFYVFNHPSNEVIYKISERLLNYLEIEVDSSLTIDRGSFPTEISSNYLNSVQASLEPVYSNYGFDVEDFEYMVRVSKNEYYRYSLSEFVNAEFDKYRKRESLREDFDFAKTRRLKIGY